MRDHPIGYVDRADLDGWVSGRARRALTSKGSAATGRRQENARMKPMEFNV